MASFEVEEQDQGWGELAAWSWTHSQEPFLTTAMERLEHCIDTIKHWMTCNYLRMNDAKTEVIPVVHMSASYLAAGRHALGPNTPVLPIVWNT